MTKGFTLVELLAVIVILAVILVIAIPQVLKVVENSRINTYKNQEDLLVNAAKVYMFKAIDELIIGDGESLIIDISELQDANLIQGVKISKSGDFCDGYVLVSNINYKYEYIPFIDCGQSYVSKNYSKNGLVLDMDLGDYKSNNYFIDKSVNLNHGLDFNTYLTSNRFLIDNKATNFNGTSSYIELDSLQLSENKSFLFWVNAENFSTESSSWRRIFSDYINSSNFYLSGVTSNAVYWVVRDNDIEYRAGVNIERDQWYHVAGTYDFNNKDIKIYINGEKVENPIITPNGWGGNAHAVLNIGRRSQGVGYFQGSLSEIKIYNRVLTPKEIKHIYDLES